MTQYRQKDEEVMSLVQVVHKAAAVLQRQSTPVAIVGVNVSGMMQVVENVSNDSRKLKIDFSSSHKPATGFCNREIISEDDTRFEWPETIGGANASFLCSNNATVSRQCGVGGKWQDFDREGCITGY